MDRSAVTEVVVEVGPVAVRGPAAVAGDVACAALDFIDDDYAVAGDRLVTVERLWGEVMHAAAGGTAAAVVVVHPRWWSPTRIDTVCAAAYSAASEVVAVDRSSALAAGLSAQIWAVVEVAPDFVTITGSDGRAAVVQRRHEHADTARAVAAEVAAGVEVLVDAPNEVAGATVLGMTIVDVMRDAGLVASVADAGWLQRSVRMMRTPPPMAVSPPAGRRPGVAWRGAALLGSIPLAVAALWAASIAGPRGAPSTDEMPLTLFVEGRVALKIPAVWTVERVVSGPGSARVQVNSPSDPDAALHITQSVIPPGEPTALVAARLRDALDQQPAGAFVDFDPDDRRADRPAVTYREVREGHDVAWTVVTDGSVRIAIGCQYAPDHEQSIRHACEEAIRSAHAVF